MSLVHALWTRIVVYITNAMSKILTVGQLGQITARPLVRVRVTVRVGDGPCPRGLDKNFSLHH